MQRFGLIAALFAFIVVGAPQAGSQTSGGLIRRTPESAAQAQREERSITIDVEVRDSSRKPVAGLNQQDVTLLDSNHPVPITSFKEVGGRTSQPPTEVILLVT